MSSSDRWWEAPLRRAGLEPGDVLGSGMEGTVVAVPEDRVAKAWHARASSEVERLRSFYAAVDQASSQQERGRQSTGPALGFPLIERVLAVGGTSISVERRLPGTALRPVPRETPEPVTDDEVESILTVLASLAAQPVVAGLDVLPVLEGEPAFDSGAHPFEASLAGLVRRRAPTEAGPLARRLPELDRLLEATVAALGELSPSRPTLLHGDLVPANVLVDAGGRPVAVVDFGFLTTVGDPAFDAAVAASVFDMYGPHARDSEERLDAAILERFGHDPRRLGIHQAAYALVTSTCFSPSGSDGHFEWCARMLERDDVRAAVGC